MILELYYDFIVRFLDIIFNRKFNPFEYSAPSNYLVPIILILRGNIKIVL